MNTTLYVVKEDELFSKYGEKINAPIYKQTFCCDCISHYPSDSKETISQLRRAYENGFEGTVHYEIAFIEMCHCKCDVCDLDIEEGYYSYFLNKYWKIVGTKVFDDCGCITIKLTLQRLTPRETSKNLIECVSCLGECVNCGKEVIEDDNIKRTTENRN